MDSDCMEEDDLILSSGLAQETETGEQDRGIEYNSSAGEAACVSHALARAVNLFGLFPLSQIQDPEPKLATHHTQTSLCRVDPRIASEMTQPPLRPLLVVISFLTVNFVISLSLRVLASSTGD